MIELNLFLGFPVDPLFAKALEQVNPHAQDQYIKETDDYLREVSLDGMRFIGKNLGILTTLSDLELTRTNIYSILKKLVPDFPYDETPLYLFSIKK